MMDNISILPYSDDRFDDLCRQISLLQEHVASIDPLGRAHPFNDGGERYVRELLEKVGKGNGVIFLTVDENGACVGMVAGIVQDEEVWSDGGYVRPRQGEVIELVVDPAMRGRGIGEWLMQRVEDYFREMGCPFSSLHVFAPNTGARRFYDRLGYAERMQILMKPL